MTDAEARETVRGMLADWDAATPEQRGRALTDAQRAARLAELRGIATQLNGFYPRPVGQQMTARETRLRARAREIEAALQTTDEEG